MNSLEPGLFGDSHTRLFVGVVNHFRNPVPLSPPRDICLFFKYTFVFYHNIYDHKNRKETQQKIKRDWRKDQEERVKQGKKPIFMKKSQVKQKELEIKFQKLSSDGKVDKFLEKRRKKQASKDRKKLPFDARVRDD